MTIFIFMLHLLFSWSTSQVDLSQKTAVDTCQSSETFPTECVRFTVNSIEGSYDKIKRVAVSGINKFVEVINAYSKAFKVTLQTLCEYAEMIFQNNKKCKQ